MKTFLISGGAGFIGSHLCDLIINDGARVICVDNFVTGSEKNIAHLKQNKNFDLIVHNVSEPLHIDDDMDYIMHFASPASPLDFKELAIPILKVGSLGTYHLLGMAKAKAAKFILASTSEVYGDPLEHPQKESYRGNVNIIGERGVYDESKRFAESITCAYNRMHGVNVGIVRIFNTYGPRMRANDGRVVPNFINQALKSEPITVYGDGSQTRSFCYVSDLTAGIYKLTTECDYKFPINLGSDTENTIEELAAKIIDLTGSGSELAYQELPQDDPKVRRPDLALAREKLGFELKVPLKEGLKRTVEYFKSG